MPKYYFHLSFGDRLSPDTEGAVLAGRGAARDEANVIVGELSRGTRSGQRNPWAGWFLRVADEEEEFLVLPLAQPALSLVPAQEGPQHAAARRPPRAEVLAREVAEQTHA